MEIKEYRDHLTSVLIQYTPAGSEPTTASSLSLVQSKFDSRNTSNTRSVNKMWFFLSSGLTDMDNF